MDRHRHNLRRIVLLAGVCFPVTNNRRRPTSSRLNPSHAARERSPGALRRLGELAGDGRIGELSVGPVLRTLDGVESHLHAVFVRDRGDVNPQAEPLAPRELGDQATHGGHGAARHLAPSGAARRLAPLPLEGGELDGLERGRARRREALSPRVGRAELLELRRFHDRVKVRPARSVSLDCPQAGDPYAARGKRGAHALPCAADPPLREELRTRDARHTSRGAPRRRVYRQGHEPPRARAPRRLCRDPLAPSGRVVGGSAARAARRTAVVAVKLAPPLAAALKVDFPRPSTTPPARAF